MLDAGLLLAWSWQGTYHPMGSAMHVTRRRAVLFLAALAVVLGGHLSRERLSAQESARPIQFNRDVRPILSDGCFSCHGPNEAARQAALRLDVPEGALEDRGRYGGPVIVPGNPDASLLFHRITTEDTRERMPRGRSPLTADQIATLRRWIEDGAEYQAHWAFIPPERSPLPPVADAEWLRNAVDSFVLARLEQDGLTPSEEADRATLLRRVTLDLTGVPPTPREVGDFLNADSPGRVRKGRRPAARVTALR